MPVGVEEFQYILAGGGFAECLHGGLHGSRQVFRTWKAHAILFREHEGGHHAGQCQVSSVESIIHKKRAAVCQQDISFLNNLVGTNKPCFYGVVTYHE